MNLRISLALMVGLAALAAIVLVAGTPFAGDTQAQDGIERVGPKETRELVATGQSLLICSYNDNRCSSILLEGALLRSELDAMIADLPKDHPLIFYCG